MQRVYIIQSFLYMVDFLLLVGPAFLIIITLVVFVSLERSYNRKDIVS